VLGRRLLVGPAIDIISIWNRLGITRFAEGRSFQEQNSFGGLIEETETGWDPWIR
jgi:hypothetical protein